MKKLLALIAVMGGAFTLSGCELNNQELKDVISKCKEDTECKAILDKEIDEALEARGFFGFNESGESDYGVFYGLDLTEEEQALFETLEALDTELWEKLEGMSEEELSALELQEVESMLGRTLTDDEKAAIEAVEALYTSIDFTEEETFETEQAYLEFYLGRELTQEESAALTVIEDFYNVEDMDENGDFEITEAQEAAFDLIEDLYETAFEMNEVQELELLLERQLTTEELAAFDLLETISDDVWFDEEAELTEDQTAALELIDALYDTAFENYEIVELERALDRELSIEELTALETVNNLYAEMYDNYDEDTEYDFVSETVSYYEVVLGRELTDQEKEAIELSLEFSFYEDDFYFDDDFYFEDDIDFEGIEIIKE